MINFRESKSVDKLSKFCTTTGGSYKLIEDFNQLKYRMQLLAENSLYLVQMKIQYEEEQEFKTAKYFFDIGAKIKTVPQGQRPMSETTHRMNLEEPDPRIMSKDRWPIPLISS